MQASELAREAAELIDLGWCRNSYERDGNVCSAGAIYQVAYSSARQTRGDMDSDCPNNKAVEELLVALAEVMREQMRPDVWPGYRPKDWSHAEGLVVVANDNYAHDKADVLACFEKAAIMLEERA